MKGDGDSGEGVRGERHGKEPEAAATDHVAADWWQDAAGARRSRGLVLLLPDPPAAEAMAIEVAETMGAATARLDRLEHCWMAEAPERVAEALDEFWATLEPSESMT
jgi:hypothetical protein